MSQTWTLGDSSQEIEVVDSEQLRELSLHMAEQCRHHLDIVSRHLDPTVYDTTEFVAAVTAIATASSRARIRLLVCDPEPLRHRGHRLLTLCTRLSSFVMMRIPGAMHKDYNEGLLVADNTGYIYRQFADRYEGKACFNDRRSTRHHSHQFDELWEHAEPDPNFRRLYL